MPTLNHVGSYSSILFAHPSLLSGAARTFDLGGTFNGFNISRDGDAADAAALQADWRAVGEDMKAAADEWAQEMGVR